MEATAIRRIKNEYLDVQARDSISSREFWQIQEEIFGRIEAVFPEPGHSGIADTLTKFFRYWHDLNNTPQDPGVKAAVAEVGDELATMMKEAYRQLENISASILQINDGSVAGGQMKDQVDTVNGILAQVRELTESIKLIYAHGNQPNDLLDKRDLLLDRLSEYGPVSVVHETVAGKPTGEIVLTFFGMDVRDAGVSVSVTYTPGDPGNPENPGEVRLLIGDGAANKEISLTTSKSGTLPGLEEIRRRVFGYAENLNKLSAALTSTVNQVHNPDGGGQDFFTGSLADGSF
ncbi:MAG: flagellar hook-associated protein FlgK, partial [Moorella sp. (in: Bacteria)]|nr:flagellar hook-associated protein FlgK [Moorella sp. (in: firmicutes)]